MLTKHIIFLFLITRNSNDSLSIKEDIELAKKLLEFHGIPDAINKDVCDKNKIDICLKKDTKVCAARLLKGKMEFKQFDNPCFMAIDNFCNSQLNIWSIKHTGPCKLNGELRRYAKKVEEMAEMEANETTNDDVTLDDTDTTPYETTTDVIDGYSTTDRIEATESVVEIEEPANDTKAEENDTTIDESDVAETTTDEFAATTDETEMTAANGDHEMEVGKIFYDDGSVKAALRQGGSAKFPPIRANMTFNKKPCAKRELGCPEIYQPVCLYFGKEEPDNVTYYYFINACEAEQYTCYHPEKPIEGLSILRAGYCAHIQYINYSRYIHTISAWGHYGWLNGPWPFSHILKPHERG